MLKLEGIIKGGAAVKFKSSLDLIKTTLKDPLVHQINDRRSAISRQACHLLSILVAAFGHKFEVLVIFFIPVVSRVCLVLILIKIQC